MTFQDWYCPETSSSCPYLKAYAFLVTALLIAAVGVIVWDRYGPNKVRNPKCIFVIFVIFVISFQRRCVFCRLELSTPYNKRRHELICPQRQGKK